MGIDASSSFGYGLIINDEKMIEDINEEVEDFEGKDFSFMFQGGFDAQDILCLCIEKSVISIDCWEKPKKINPAKFIVGDDWDEKLHAWAKKHGVKKPKIGWYLCCSMS